ncbi:MAG: glycosyltransferase family 2 protein [Bacteroidaceae bacterium]
MEPILWMIELLLFLLFALNVVYLFIFSIASLFPLRQVRVISAPLKKIGILIPAYQEDSVIVECVDACVAQDYPKELFEIVVISDGMKEATNQSLSTKCGVKVINVNFENSTKAKALNFAMQHIGEFDVAVVFDADNTVKPDFLTQINAAFSDSRVRIVQCHRMAKNLNTKMALLDAVSEEINNSIFRKGHARLGFSGALIGSGMAFCYPLFREVMKTVDAVGGFDRALELTFLHKGERVEYLPYVDVLDEKVQNKAAFTNQRRRWMSAQFHYLGRFIGKFPKALLQGNFDFCDKLMQQMTIPRVMLLGLIFLMASVLSFVHFDLAIKWWLIFVVLIAALLIAIPKPLYQKRLFFALLELPHSFGLMFFNLFRLKGANKHFIHTPHGETKE